MRNRRTITLSRPALRLAAAALAWASAAFAQYSLTVTDGTTPSTLEPGSPPTSYPLSAFEHYSPYTGQISFAFPLHHIGGRGTASFDMTLHIQPQPWTVESFPGTGGLVTIYPAWWTIGAGYSPGALWGRESAQFTTCPGNPTQVPQHTLAG